MPQVIFELGNVTYRYDDQIVAVAGVSLTVKEGERVALLGANGSGKSTLLRIMDGLYFPESGSVRFSGEPIEEHRFQEESFRSNFRRRVGLVFQNPDVQLFNPTVFDEVAYGPLQLRWPKEQVRERVTQALDDMGIAHLKDRVPYRLSGGEKKRVAIASVLVLDPDVLLLDEPTSGLDPHSQSHMIDLLANANGQRRTVITATHDLNAVEDIADRCHILDGGKLVASGTPQQILPDHALLERTNLIHAHRHRHGGVIHSHPHLHGHGGHQH